MMMHRIWHTINGMCRRARWLGCAALLALPMTASARETLYIFTWTDYTSPEVIDAFEKQYNARVVPK